MEKAKMVKPMEEVNKRSKMKKPMDKANERSKLTQAKIEADKKVNENKWINAVLKKQLTD